MLNHHTIDLKPIQPKGEGGKLWLRPMAFSFFCHVDKMFEGLLFVKPKGYRLALLGELASYYRSFELLPPSFVCGE